MVVVVNDDRLPLNIHLMEEGIVGAPCTTSHSTNFFHHLIDLFEGKALGLWYEDIGE